MPVKTIAEPIHDIVATNLVTPAFTFTLDSFKITNTRSLHEDSDYVSIAVAVGSNPAVSSPTKSMGNLNNGTFQVNLSIPSVAVGPTDVVAFSYAIVNSGYNQDSVEQDLKKAAAALASKAATAAAGAVGGALGGPPGSLLSMVGSEAFGWLLGELTGIIFPNCDGPVAAGNHAYTGAQLSQQTANGATIGATDNNPGTNSATGCGSNSQYYVTWSIAANAPIRINPVIGGGRPIELGNPTLKAK
ncbi:MAG TPA: hypothetical protein VHX37_03400 [Acidobacteriaceae bacterium]|jgi:hypothetical protein|nr:hypothetical protein [Acidobacteriaceae bacterium]